MSGVSASLFFTFVVVDVDGIVFRHCYKILSLELLAVVSHLVSLSFAYTSLV